MNKSIFLTGATGLLGQYLLSYFYQEGYKVRALTRDVATVPAVLKPLAEWVEGDLHDVPFLGDCLTGVEYIVHAAGKVSYQARDKAELYRTNVEGTANLVNVALDFPIRKFLFISSIAALGRHKDNLIIDEKAQWLESDLNTEYAKSKYLGELEVWRGAAEGLPVLVVQPSVVLGIGDWTQSSTQIFRYVWREKGFYPRGQMSYVDVRDVAEVVLKLLPTDTTDERYILNAGEVTYADLFKHIAERFGKRPPRKELTPWLGAIAWRLSALKVFFFGGKPIVSRETVMLSKNNYVYKNDKVCKTLAFQFRPIEETLDWACKGLKEKA